MTDKLQHIIHPLPDCAPEIGRTLWMLEDCRKRTRKALQNLNPVTVDWVGGLTGHSIGTLLYHVAAIEIDWFVVEVMQGGVPESVWDDFTWEVRDEQGQLTAVTGVSLADHWARLDKVRGLLLDAYRAMSLEDYRRPREMDKYDVTPDWVLHHLMQHEAEHRDEIIALRAGAEANLKPK